MGKTRVEVEELKARWACDPSWDLKATEGFEEYSDELEKFQEAYVSAPSNGQPAAVQKIEPEMAVQNQVGNTTLIPLAEYARLLDKNIQVAAQMARRGSFHSARKIGRDWFIDKNEAYPDNRQTAGGKFVDWRNNRPNKGKKKSGRPKKKDLV